MKKKSKLIELFLVCSKCARENYRTSRPKSSQGEKLKLLIKKYCKFCRYSLLHKELKIKKK